LEAAPRGNLIKDPNHTIMTTIKIIAPALTFSFLVRIDNMRAGMTSIAIITRLRMFLLFIFI